MTTKRSELPLDPDAFQPGVSSLPLHLAPGLQLLVFLGGCIGTLGRYEVSKLLPATSDSWPKATFIVNIVGAFALGLLLRALFHCGEDKGKLRLIRLGIGTGMIGGFTTYSTLAIETDTLIKGHHLSLAVIYALTSVIVGCVACTLGIFAATQKYAPEKRPQ